MTDREKLNDIVCGAMQDQCVEHCNHSPCFCVEKVVDALTANGVTVQQWIPVTERLPEPNKLVLCIGARGGMFIGYHCQSRKRSEEKSMFFYVPNSRNARSAIKWQPLPEAPKGE